MLAFYHKDDLDGHCSGAIVKYRYPKCEMIGIDYDDEFPWDKISSDPEVFMVDFCLQPFEDMVRLIKGYKLTWIDHHKSVVDDIEKWSPSFLPFQHCDGRINTAFAACELTWMHLYPREEMPYPIHLLGRYDIWNLSDEQTLPFQYGMRLHDTHPDNQGFWRRLFPEGETCSGGILHEGQTVLKYVKQYHTKYAQFAFEVEFDGLKCIAINKLLASSQLFDSIWDKKKYHAMVAFGRKKKGRWLVSIYSDRKDVDLSKIAKARGGGGHQGASGFSCEVLPWEE